MIQIPVTWDPCKGSPDLHLSEDGLVAQVPVNTGRQFHAAHVHTSVRLHAGLDFARFDFLVEDSGHGLIDVGVVTSHKAKRSALHWPGLRDTSAWTYASSGERFWNIPGADDATWCRPFGEAYTSGDVISLVLEDGSLKFLRNEVLQGIAVERLPLGTLFIGTTLCPGSKLRLHKTEIKKQTAVQSDGCSK
jgi:hypothetical protein